MNQTKIAGVTLLNHKRKMKFVTEEYGKNQYDHIMRMSKERIAPRTWLYKPTGKRRIGRIEERLEGLVRFLNSGGETSHWPNS